MDYLSSSKLIQDLHDALEKCSPEDVKDLVLKLLSALKEVAEKNERH